MTASDAATEPFWLRNQRGEAIRGLTHHVAPADVVTPPGPRPVVVAVGGLGMPLRQTFRPALYLLANGFTVVRFEPTNYAPTSGAGLSDGHLGDFTLTGLLGDLRQVVAWASSRFDVSSVGVFAISLSARAALRAAAREPDLLRIVGSIACVVDVRATLAAVTLGADPLDQWYAGELPVEEETGSVHNRQIRVRGLESLIVHGWTEPGATVSDLVAAQTTRFVNVHGVQDPLVGVGRVLSTFHAASNARVVLIPRAGHELSPAHTARALAVLVPEYQAVLRPGRPPAPMCVPSAADVMDLRRSEREAIRGLNSRLPAR